MRILRFEASNIKRLKVVEIVPDGSIVQITGPNGSGKSSVLDSIWFALGGAENIPSKPVRDGEQKAMVKLTLGDGADVELIVTRRLNAASGGTSLTVETPNGAVFRSPQRMLDELIGSLAFDPLAFSRMDPRAQLDQVRALVKIDTDIDALDRANAADYDRRTEVNRHARQLRNELVGYVIVADGIPDDLAPVDVAALMDELTQAADLNLKTETRRANRAVYEQRILDQNAAADAELAKVPARIAELEHERDEGLVRIDHDITNAEARLAELRKDRTEFLARAADAVGKVQSKAESDATFLRDQSKQLREKIDNAGPLPDLVDVGALRTRIDEANELNARIQAESERRALEARAVAYESEVERLTNAMQARTDERTAAIARADMPVKDLSFGDGMVLYRGLPFDQASSAEQLRVSVAIAMAANPKLRVLRIQDGSLLDSASLKLIADMTEARGYQAWIECVDESGAVGVVMEEGTVKAVNPPSVVAKTPKRKAGARS